MNRSNSPVESLSIKPQSSPGQKLSGFKSHTLLVSDKHFPVWTRQLGLYCDNDGLWRCGGCLEEANIPQETKQPIILPRGYNLTELIVHRTNERVEYLNAR